MEINKLMLCYQKTILKDLYSEALKETLRSIIKRYGWNNKVTISSSTCKLLEHLSDTNFKYIMFNVEYRQYKIYFKTLSV